MLEEEQRIVGKVLGKRERWVGGKGKVVVMETNLPVS